MIDIMGGPLSNVRLGRLCWQNHSMKALQPMVGHNDYTEIALYYSMVRSTYHYDAHYDSPAIVRTWVKVCVRNSLHCPMYSAQIRKDYTDSARSPHRSTQTPHRLHGFHRCHGHLSCPRGSILGPLGHRQPNSE